MSTIQLCGAALCAVMLIILVRQSKNEFSPFVSLAACLMIFFAALAALYPTISYIKEIIAENTFSSYMEILLKALGIGFVTQISAEICRDCGESAVASRVELLGKAEILLLSLPLIRELLSLCGQVMA